MNEGLIKPAEEHSWVLSLLISPCISHIPCGRLLLDSHLFPLPFHGCCRTNDWQLSWVVWVKHLFSNPAEPMCDLSTPKFHLDNLEYFSTISEIQGDSHLLSYNAQLVLWGSGSEVWSIYSLKIWVAHSWRPGSQTTSSQPDIQELLFYGM